MRLRFISKESKARVGMSYHFSSGVKATHGNKRIKSGHLLDLRGGKGNVRGAARFGSSSSPISLFRKSGRIF